MSQHVRRSVRQSVIGRMFGCNLEDSRNTFVSVPRRMPSDHLHHCAAKTPANNSHFTWPPNTRCHFSTMKASVDSSIARYQKIWSLYTVKVKTGCSQYFIKDTQTLNSILFWSGSQWGELVTNVVIGIHSDIKLPTNADDFKCHLRTYYLHNLTAATSAAIYRLRTLCIPKCLYY